MIECVCTTMFLLFSQYFFLFIKNRKGKNLEVTEGKKFSWLKTPISLLSLESAELKRDFFNISLVEGWFPAIPIHIGCHGVKSSPFLSGDYALNCTAHTWTLNRAVFGPFGETTRKLISFLIIRIT